MGMVRLAYHAVTPCSYMVQLINRDPRPCVTCSTHPILDSIARSLCVVIRPHDARTYVGLMVAVTRIELRHASVVKCSKSVSQELLVGVTLDH
jgi:hypothetical protein